MVTGGFCQKLLQNSYTNPSAETNFTFAVCKHQKHCSGTLLLAEDVSHGFGN